MPKVKFNPVIDEVHGKSGNLVFRRSPNGDIHLIKLADMSRVKWSEAQKENRLRFKDANTYAKAAMADPRIRARYQKIATKEGRRAYHVAVSDYLRGNNLLEE